ncbi:MAG: MFS transporter [Planctomycetes bacterium]|nr:MFS transporter [Planctomycetota bacterium]
MAHAPLTTTTKLSWRFPATFWFANVSELFERAAFYGMFIALNRYLSDEVGYGDVGANNVAAVFSFFLYLLPPFMGTLADRIGFRPALIMAFALLTAGYALLGAVQLKWTAITALGLIAVGGAIVKPVIMGTAAKCSDAAHRPRAFSIFYFMVNIGAFLGKTFAYPLRVGFDSKWLGHVELGLVGINYYASCMALCALIVVTIAYRSPDAGGVGRSFSEVWRAFVRVLRNGRFMTLILIVAGFWMIQGQLYASMPKYLVRLLGPKANPEWLANINPFVVVCCVVGITHLVRHVKPVYSIAVSLAIIPCSALAIAIAPIVISSLGREVTLPGGVTIYTLTMMMIVGIGLQGLAECFLSPKFMEYASKQAPPGEEGMYMGFQNLPTSISWLFGFIAAGHLLDTFCPDPMKLAKTDPAQHAQWQAAINGQGPMPAAYASAHYIWYVFAAIGVTALIALLIFNTVTSREDRAAAQRKAG